MLPELELVYKKDQSSQPNSGLLATGLLGISRSYLNLGRVSEAAAAAEQLGSLCNGDPEDLVSIARELTLCSVKASDGATGARYADQSDGLPPKGHRIRISQSRDATDRCGIQPSPLLRRLWRIDQRTRPFLLTLSYDDRKESESACFCYTAP